MTIDTVELVHPEANIINNVTFVDNIALNGNGGGLYLDNVS